MMNKLREAAELVLEAMELHVQMYPQMDKGYMVDAREALRQALAEKHECETCANKRKRLTEAGLLKSPLRGIDGEPNYEPVVFTNMNSVDMLIGTNEVMRVTGDGITFSERVDAIDTSESYVDKTEKREHEPWDTSDMAYRANGLSMEQELVEPPSNKYNSKRIAWELERTAMGDGYYGNALYVAMDMPQTTRADREMLNRYMHGSNLKTDHVKLQDLAMRIYTAPASKPWVSLTDEEVHEAAIKCVKSGQSVNAAIRSIEAKLKELNHG